MDAGIGVLTSSLGSPLGKHAEGSLPGPGSGPHWRGSPGALGDSILPLDYHARSYVLDSVEIPQSTCFQWRDHKFAPDDRTGMI